MPTLDQLESALVNADKAGDVAAATALAAEIRRQRPAAAEAGQAINSIPRQIGLTARYGIEGLANSAQLITEPIRAITDRLTGSTGKTLPLGALATQGLDALGVPKPETANERVIGDASRLVAGTGGLGAAAKGVAGLRQAPQLVRDAAEFLSSNMGAQTTGAAGAGLAQGASREAGGSPAMQTGAALLGTVAGGLGASGVNAAAEAVSSSGKRLLSRLTPQQMDQRISAVLQRADVDYSALPNAVRTSLRGDLENALRAGQELDPRAVARLADLRSVGATPTRGMVTLDPVQITREQNLAKIGANSADGTLQGLPRVQNSNNAAFINTLDNAGAVNGNAFNAGASTIGGISGRDASLREGVNQLYEAARNMPGGTIPLDRKTMVDNIYGALARDNKMAFLPENVDNYLRQFSAGVVRAGGQDHAVPFDANALDNLLTTIATAQRGATDGNVRAALSSVRNAINQTPITPVKNTFGGNQMVTEQGAQFLRGQDAQAGEFMGALNDARRAAAQRFGWQESAAPIEAALNGAQPDKFVQRFIINGSLHDAEAIAQNAPVEPIKNAILAHLKDKALSDATSEVGKFSQAGFNKALKALDERKLALFFSPEEIGQLQALGRASSYAQVQPAGSAVNNSSSGALLLGKGYDALMGLANKVPGLGPLVVPPIRNIEIALRNQQAQNVGPALLAAQQAAQQRSLPQNLLLPALVLSGGLSPAASP